MAFFQEQHEDALAPFASWRATCGVWVNYLSDLEEIHIDVHVKADYTELTQLGHIRYTMDSGNGADNNLMRIGDLAKRAGTTMRTIRYYEERGLIEPARRSKGGFRLYHEEELPRLRLIRSLQVLDVPLAQVKAFFDQRRRGRAAAEIAPALQGVLQEHLRDMERRIAEYRAMQDSVRETIDILNSCRLCSHEPGPDVCPQCPVLAGRASVPLHMQAVVEAGRRGAVHAVEGDDVETAACS
jgi:MerR family Zn(II)-responsive transcriptional regulator of zntA